MSLVFDCETDVLLRPFRPQHFEAPPNHPRPSFCANPLKNYTLEARHSLASLVSRPCEAGFSRFRSLARRHFKQIPLQQTHPKLVARPFEAGFSRFRGLSRPLRGRRFAQIRLERTHPRPQGTGIYIII